MSCESVLKVCRVNEIEKELIRLAQSGNKASFCELVRSYERRIFMLALYYCKNRHDAEDLSQEVWLKVYRSIKTFRGESSFYTWVRRITINTLLNHRRSAPYSFDPSANGREALSLSSQSVPEGGITVLTPDPEGSLHKKLMTERLFQSLEVLSPQQRVILFLKYQDGLTYGEIAESLGCSVGSAKKALFRAIVKLRNELGIQLSPVDRDDLSKTAS